MKILVNGREAVLKANASFEYVSENPLFTEAEDYTMEIPFPMKDCPQNISIFGPLHVKGVDISKVLFPCEIQTDAFVKSGILTITSVSDTEVKGQFLEGMSQQNFASSLPDVYLTDLDFSQWDGTKGGWENYENSPEFGWEEMPVYDLEKEDQFNTHFIYLEHLIKLIARATGVSVDLTDLHAIPMFKHILVTNARRPKSWENPVEYVRALNLSLPRWTIKEFFHQIELFFGCVCVISNKTVTFAKCSSYMRSDSAVNLNVLDDFEVELSEKQSQYRGSIGYKLPSDCNPDNINSCPNLMEQARFSESIREMDYGTMYAIISRAKDGDNFDVGNVDDRNIWFGLQPCFLYYLTDIKQYAVVTSTQVVEQSNGDHPFRRLQKIEIINQYGFLGDGTELKIAPCPLKPGMGYYYDDSYPVAKIRIPLDPEEVIIPYYYGEDVYFENKPMLEYLSEGVKEEKDMYFDKLWIVVCEERNLYDGGEDKQKFVYTRKYETAIEWWGGHVEGTEDMDLGYTRRLIENPYTLIPSDPSIQSLASLPKVDETKLYRYKFLAKTLPSPTSIFLIKGKKYACIKLTAQITVKGMSELVEGEFYEIID